MAVQIELRPGHSDGRPPTLKERVARIGKRRIPSNAVGEFWQLRGERNPGHIFGGVILRSMEDLAIQGAVPSLPAFQDINEGNRIDSMELGTDININALSPDAQEEISLRKSQIDGLITADTSTMDDGERKEHEAKLKAVRIFIDGLSYEMKPAILRSLGFDVPQGTYDVDPREFRTSIENRIKSNGEPVSRQFVALAGYVNARDRVHTDLLFERFKNERMEIFREQTNRLIDEGVLPLDREVFDDRLRREADWYLTDEISEVLTYDFPYVSRGWAVAAQGFITFTKNSYDLAPSENVSHATRGNFADHELVHTYIAGKRFVKKEGEIVVATKKGFYEFVEKSEGASFSTNHWIDEGITEYLMVLLGRDERVREERADEKKHIYDTAYIPVFKALAEEIGYEPFLKYFVMDRDPDDPDPFNQARRNLVKKLDNEFGHATLIRLSEYMDGYVLDGADDANKAILAGSKKLLGAMAEDKSTISERFADEELREYSKNPSPAVARELYPKFNELLDQAIEWSKKQRKERLATLPE